MSLGNPAQIQLMVSETGGSRQPVGCKPAFFLEAIMRKFTPPTKIGARFRPPAQVTGRTAAAIDPETIMYRDLGNPLHRRFIGRAR